MISSAVISADGRYRYRLHREWDASLPTVLFVMLNPSTADDRIDDPTIRRVIGFAKSWGYGGVYVANLFAFRSTDPKGLLQISDPIGPDNVGHIQELVSVVDRVVYAWGNGRNEPDWLREIVKEPFCIDLGKRDVPKHPLFLPKNSRLIPFAQK